MSPANGHAHENGGPMTGPPTALEVPITSPQSAERVAELVAALEVPFDPAQIEWRVTNTTQNQQPVRGQVIPYADQRAYTDRLNACLLQRVGLAGTESIPAQTLSGPRTKGS